MKEIRFRAWDEKHKHLFQVQEMGYSEGKLWTTNRRNGYKHWNCPLMQYVGLHDKNGKEIYEGDIVKCLENHGPVGDIETAIIVSFNSFGVNLQEWIFNDKSTYPEIIGNIYENPNLINSC